MIKPTECSAGLFFYELPVTRHLIRHAVSVRVREKNNKSNPVITAPIILVATNSIAKSIIENNTVARIDISSTVRIDFIQHGKLLQHMIDTEAISNSPRYTTAIPKSTHKNAGVTVMAAVIRRKAAIIPTVMLAMRATVVHEPLQLQSDVDIFITSLFSICVRGV